MTKDSSVQVVALRRQEGAVAVLTALTVVVLIGMAGLVLDLGHLYITKTEMQNAADACALSAARELNAINASTVTRATDAGIAAGTRNKVDFQGKAAVIQPADITFASNLAADGNGNYLNFSRNVDKLTEYVRCAPHESQTKSVAMWFMGVLGIGAQEMRAAAIAKFPRTLKVCAVPLVMCAPGGDATKLSVGDWYSGRLSSGGGASGDYGWLEFPGQGGGTDGLRDMIAGEGLCEFQHVSKVPLSSGESNGAAQAWNTRFGLYGGSYKLDDETMTAHKPDRTGWAYRTHTPGGVYLDFVNRQRNNDAYDPSSNLDKNGHPIDYPGNPRIASSNQLREHGDDRRVTIMPVVDCEQGGKSVAVKGWACALMLAPMEDPNPPGKKKPEPSEAADIVEFLGMTTSAECNVGGGPHSGFPKLVR
ncbi:pilus assembly protein TadG-related protein [Noviherbaspirillum agri]